jgi:hypothetical protein
MAAPSASTSGGSNGVQDASLADDARDESAADDDVTIAPDAGGSTWGPPDASCPRSGSFTCGSTECDRATQYCSQGIVAPQCEPLAKLACAFDGGTCAACPTCECIPPTAVCFNGAATTCTCFQDNFGALTLTCSQSACYGSPPARLDRAPLRSIS